MEAESIETTTKLNPRPYLARQEELVRALNERLASAGGKTDLIVRLRRSLLDEQSWTTSPTLAFLSGCRLTNRLDLL